MTLSSQLVASGMWRWLQGTGIERFELQRAGREWILRGTVLTLDNHVPAEARYELVCDDRFRTRRAQVSVRTPAGERTLQIAAQDGRWFENGHENLAVKGAIDIDLGWSPSTNTLPIRRMNLAVGKSSGEFIAAWVRFPELVLEPLAEALQVAGGGPLGAGASRPRGAGRPCMGGAGGCCLLACHRQSSASIGPSGLWTGAP